MLVKFISNEFKWECLRNLMAYEKLFSLLFENHLDAILENRKSSVHTPNPHSCASTKIHKHKHSFNTAISTYSIFESFSFHCCCFQFHFRFAKAYVYTNEPKFYRTIHVRAPFFVMWRIYGFMFVVVKRDRERKGV